VVAEIQKPDSEKIQAACFRALAESNLNQFDLANKQYEGRLYSLSPASSKAIAETLGFAARFDSESVQTAYCDAQAPNFTFVFEMVKNTKPIDVGLRYMADRWAPVDGLNRPEQPALSHSLKYQAKTSDLPENIVTTLGKEINLPDYDPDLFFIRVNFKDLNVAVIAERTKAASLPDGYLRSFFLHHDQILSKDPFADKIHNQVEDSFPSKISGTAASQSFPKPEDMQVTALNDNNSTTMKYATYSRSEIDSLLKKQSEGIAGSLNQKIASQLKSFQELVKAQEKEIKRIIDNLNADCGNVRKQLEIAEAKHLSESQKLVEQSSKQLKSEVEQFKTYLSKQVAPNLKTLDDRIASIIDDHKQKAQTESKIDPTAISLAVVALVLSIINLIGFFAKH
jgi:hypothetical protein